MEQPTTYLGDLWSALEGLKLAAVLSFTCVEELRLHSKVVVGCLRGDGRGNSQSGWSPVTWERAKKKFH